MSESSIRILVAEDNVINTRLILAMLEDVDCDIVTVSDGVQAVARNRAEAFDIVLMDLNMPNMDGLEATRRIRAGAQPMRDVRIVALTAHSDDEIQRLCIEAGMDAFLSKPVDIAALVAMLDVRPDDQALPREA